MYVNITLKIKMPGEYLKNKGARNTLEPRVGKTEAT